VAVAHLVAVVVAHEGALSCVTKTGGALAAVIGAHLVAAHGLAARGAGGDHRAHEGAVVAAITGRSSWRRTGWWWWR
jgi:hypothetical protein